MSLDQLVALQTEVATLQQRCTTLEQRIAADQQAVAESQSAQAFLTSIIDNLPHMIFVKEAVELRFVRFNKAGEALLGMTSADLIGKNDYDFFPPEEADFFTAKDREVLTQGIMLDIPEETIQTPAHGPRLLHTKKIPIIGPDGKPHYLLGISEDITERKQAEDALRKSAMQEALIEAQAAALAELSTPCIPVSDRVLVLPLIGTVDDRRAQQLTETLLHELTTRQAQVAIIDITGVALVDTHVAQGLLRAAQAAQLLGSEVVLTGIRPEVAQTLVGLGADLRGIVTRSTLQDGIAYGATADRTPR